MSTNNGWKMFKTETWKARLCIENINAREQPTHRGRIEQLVCLLHTDGVLSAQEETRVRSVVATLSSAVLKGREHKLGMRAAEALISKHLPKLGRKEQ